MLYYNLICQVDFSTVYRYSNFLSLFHNFKTLYEIFRKFFGNLYTLLILNYSFAGEPDIEEIANVRSGGDMSVLGGGGGGLQWRGGVYILKLFLVYICENFQIISPNE